MIVHSGVPQMRERASIEDDGAIAVLLLTLGTTLASLVAIFAELNGVKGAAVVEQTARLSLAGFTIICSWFFVNTIFAIHYGHDYYGARGGREGLQFPGGGDPDYWDFLYFSFDHRRGRADVRRRDHDAAHAAARARPHRCLLPLQHDDPGDRGQCRGKPVLGSSDALATSPSRSTLPRACNCRAMNQHRAAQAAPMHQPASTSVGQCTPR